MNALLTCIAVYTSILTILLIWNSVLAADRGLSDHAVHEMNVIAIWWPVAIVSMLIGALRNSIRKLFAIR